VRFILVSCLAVLLTVSAPVAVAAPADDAVTRIKQWLWPKKPVPLPVPAPLPKVEPPPVVVPPPVIEQPPPPPRAEPPKVELPDVKPQPPPPRPKVKKRKPKAAVIDDSGPDLPWPCWVVRWHAAGKCDAELEAMRIANGIPPLSPKQRRQAEACMAGLPRVACPRP